MSYKTNWFSKRDLGRLCRRVANSRGIEITADTLCDVVSGQIASGGYGGNVEEKLIRQGVSREDAEMLLSDLADSETAEGGYRELFTTEQAAEELGISVQRIKQLCAEGRMGMRVGRDWIITQDDIERNRIRKPGRPRTRKYIAWTTHNLELSGPCILAIAETREDAEAAALEELNKRDIARDIYAQTEMRNLCVWSKTKFVKHFGRRGYERAVDEYLRETAEGV